MLLLIKIGFENRQRNKKKPKNLEFRPIFCLIWAIGLYFELISATSDSLELDVNLRRLLASNNYTSSQYAFVLKDIQLDKILVSINADTMFNPASVAKVVTAAVALEKFGTNYTFKTNVYLDGKLKRHTGELEGSLYIYGGADPSLNAQRMWLFTRRLNIEGIRKIKGNIVLDDSFFDTVTIGPGFSEDKSCRAYEALVGALSANFNSLEIFQAPGESSNDSVYINILPPSTNITILNSARSSETSQNRTFELQTRQKASNTIVLATGTLPLNAAPKYSYRKVWQTWEFFGGVLHALMRENSITLDGSIIHGVVPDSLKVKQPFLVFESVPLEEIIAMMFKYSNNFVSEMVFKTLAAEYDSSREGSWEKAATIIMSWWKEQRLPGTPIVRNGSGMGNTNRYSAAQIVALLQHVWNKKTYLPEFMACLSVAGIDGTLKERFVDSSLKGIIRAKTGTLNNYGVSTLAGYILYPDATYAFAILFNNAGPQAYRHWILQEKMLELSMNKIRRSNTTN